MKTTVATFLLILTVAFASCGNGNNATDTTETSDTIAMDSTSVASETTSPPMDSAAMMKAMMDYATPGDKHKWLASMDGEWTTETKMWMDPAAPPSTSTGTVTNRMVMGGRYQQGTYKGQMNGMPFEGVSTLGYDNAEKVFVSTWMDNMGTGIMYMKGKMDDATKTINFNGTMVDPATGKECKVREVVSFPDDKTQKMEMYGDQGGKEMKWMEMTMAKK